MTPEQAAIRIGMLGVPTRLDFYVTEASENDESVQLKIKTEIRYDREGCPDHDDLRKCVCDKEKFEGTVLVTGVKEAARDLFAYEANMKRFRGDTEFAEQMRFRELDREWFRILEAYARTILDWCERHPERPMG